MSRSEVSRAEDRGLEEYGNGGSGEPGTRRSRGYSTGGGQEGQFREIRRVQCRGSVGHGTRGQKDMVLGVRRTGYWGSEGQGSGGSGGQSTGRSGGYGTERLGGHGAGRSGGHSTGGGSERHRSSFTYAE